MDNSTENVIQSKGQAGGKKPGKAQKEKKAKTPMEKKRKKKIIRRCVIGGVVALAAGYMVFSSMAAKNMKYPVMTTQALKGDIEETLSTSGKVQSERYKIYYGPAEVSVSDVNVALGDAVSAGDQLLIYDTQESEFSMNKANLQAASAKNEYSSSLYESHDNATKVEEAEMNLATVEPMIESQKVKIKNMETYLEDAQSREKVKLYNEQYRLQKELNSLQEEQSIKASEGDSIGEGVYHSIEKANNQMEKINLELKLMEEDAELTQIERDIVDEKNVLTDLETYKAKQESIRDGSEPQVLNGYQRKKLEAENALSQLEFEEAKKNYDEALNGIIADFDGIVTELNVVEGGFATPKEAVLKLESSTEVKVTFNVSKYDLEKLAVGQKADIDISGHAYTGTVTKINRMATQSSSGTPVVAAEIHIDNPDENVYLGVEAKLQVHTNFAQGALMVPIEVVNADIMGDFVYVIENGIVAKRKVTTGISSDAYIQILDGLSEGEEVITNLMNAAEGMAVEPMSMGGAASAVPASEAAESETESASEATTGTTAE